MGQCHGMGISAVVARCSIISRNIFFVVMETLHPIPSPILRRAGAVLTCVIWSEQQVWFLVLLPVWWSSARCNALLGLVCLGEGSWIYSGLPRDKQQNSQEFQEQLYLQTLGHSDGTMHRLAKPNLCLHFTQSQNVPGRSNEVDLQLQCRPMSEFSNGQVYTAQCERTQGGREGDQHHPTYAELPLFTHHFPCGCFEPMNYFSSVLPAPQVFWDRTRHVATYFVVLYSHLLTCFSLLF